MLNKKRIIKRIIIGIAIILASITSMVGASIVFRSIPNVQEFTNKEAMQATFATMLIILGITGFIAGFVVMLIED